MRIRCLARRSVAAVTVFGALAVGVTASPSGADQPRGEGNPGMARMHELMMEDNPGMARMHELMMVGNPGMARMHERMMAEG